MSTLPAFHIRPTRGWLNDPNAVVRWGGRWQVFFQHTSSPGRHGGIHWGHVSSPDLVTWREHPVAFGPTPGGPDRGGCWSGVFMAGARAPAVAYTGVGAGAGDTTVCVRYAVDESLDAWTDPVVVAGQPEGVGLVEMRDPYLFEWSGRRFALLGAGLSDGVPAVLLYSCDDLEAWRFERVWLTPEQDPLAAAVAAADIWECPQLLEVDGSWVLILSLQRAGELVGAVHLVGELFPGPDGLPAFRARTAGVLDAGPSFYAPQAIPDVDGPLLFGWVRQPEAPDGAPADDVRGRLSLPRRLLLVRGRLASVLDPALRDLVGPTVVEGVGGLLPSQAMLTLAPTAAPATATFTGAEGPLEVAIAGPTEVWLDGDVLEVFPADGTPATHTQLATTSWSVTTSNAAMAVSALRTPAPG